MNKTAYTGPFTGDQLNAQPIQKRNANTSRLTLHSMFHTIQGEGPFAGRSAVFVRLTGCNLQCPMCDTEYTANAESVSWRDIVKRVKAMPIQNGGLVVITGGEPLRQPIGLIALCEGLLDAGFLVQIETNGTLPLPGDIEPVTVQTVNLSYCAPGVYVVVSPKTGKVHHTVSDVACAYKYVVSAEFVNEDDGLPITALGHTANPQLARPPHGVPVYVQPCDTNDAEHNYHNAQKVAQIAMRYGYIAQLQMHKLLGLD